jgi:hypothetical protein
METNAVRRSGFNLLVTLLDNHASYILGPHRVFGVDLPTRRHGASQAEECANQLLRLVGRGTGCRNETDIVDMTIDEGASRMGEAV